MNAAELLNQFLALPTAEQARFSALLKGMGKAGPAKGAQQQDAQSDALLLYEAVAGAYRARCGVAIHPFAAIRKGTAAEAHLEAAVHWMTNGKEVPRRVMLALCTLAADALVLELRSYGGLLNTREDILRALQRIPAAVDRAFPSYRANNLLVVVAERVADGQLPPTNEDE